MRRTSTINIFAASLLLVISGVGASIYMWNFTDTIGTRLEANLQAIKDEAFLDKKYTALSEELNATEAQREQLGEYILDGEEGTIDLLYNLDRLAEQLAIEMKTSRLEVSETEEPDFDTLVAEFAISGPERSVMHMLEILQSLPYKSNLAGLSVSRSTNSDTGLRNMQQTVTIQISIIED